MQNLVQSQPLSNVINVKVIDSMLIWADQPNAVSYFLSENGLDYLVKISLHTTISDDIKHKISIILLKLLHSDDNHDNYESVIDKISLSIYHLSNSGNTEMLKICTQCLLQLSRSSGSEKRIADGGGLLALSAMAPIDDSEIMRNCAATLFNLACCTKFYDGLDRVARILLCLTSQDPKADIKTLAVWTVSLCSRFPELCPKLVEDGGFSLAVSSISTGNCSFPASVSAELIGVICLHNLALVPSLRIDLANKSCGKMLSLLSKCDDDDVLLLIVKTTHLLMLDDIAMTRLVHDGIISTLVKISSNSNDALIDCVVVSAIARVSKVVGNLRFLINAGVVSLMSYLLAKPYSGEELLSFKGSCRNMCTFLHNYLLNIDKMNNSETKLVISDSDVEKMFFICLRNTQSGLLVSEEDFSACSLSLLRLVRLGKEDFVLTQARDVTNAISTFYCPGSSVVIACSAATLIGLLVLACEKQKDGMSDVIEPSKILSLVISYAFIVEESSALTCGHSHMIIRNSPELVLLILRLIETAINLCQFSGKVTHELIMASNCAISSDLFNPKLKESIDLYATAILVKTSKVVEFKELMSCRCVFESIVKICHKSENLISRYQCAEIMSNLSQCKASKEKMMNFEIISIVETLSFTSHQETHFQCAMILCNLCCDAQLHKELIRQNIENSIFMICLVRSISVPTKVVCAMAMAHLFSGSDEIIKSVTERGGIRALAELCRQDSNDLANLCAYSLHSLARSELGRLALSNSRSSMKSLFSTSQSPSFVTKRLCGYAVCQLLSYDQTRLATIHSGGLVVLKYLSIICSDDFDLQEMCCWGIICAMKAQDAFFHHVRRNEIASFLVVNMSRLNKSMLSVTLSVIAVLSGCSQLRHSLVEEGCAIGLSGMVLTGAVTKEEDAENVMRAICQLSLCPTNRTRLVSANVVLSTLILCRHFQTNKSIMYLACVAVSSISWINDCKTDLVVQGGLDILCRAVVSLGVQDGSLNRTDKTQKALIFQCVATTLFNLSGDNELRQYIVDSAILGHAINANWTDVIQFFENQFFTPDSLPGASESHYSFNDTLFYIMTAILRISEDPCLKNKLATDRTVDCLHQFCEMSSLSGRQQVASIIANLTESEECRELLSCNSLTDLVMILSDTDNSFTQKCCFDATSHLSSTVKASPGLIGNMLSLASKLSNQENAIASAGSQQSPTRSIPRSSSRLRSLLSGGVFRMIADNKHRQVIDEPIDTSEYEKEGIGKNSEFVTRRIRKEYHDFQLMVKERGESICKNVIKLDFPLADYYSDGGCPVEKENQASSSIFAAVDDYPTEFQSPIIADFTCESVCPPMIKVEPGLAMMNIMLERARSNPVRDFSIASALSIRDLLTSQESNSLARRQVVTPMASSSRSMLPNLNQKSQNAGRRARTATK